MVKKKKDTVISDLYLKAMSISEKILNGKRPQYWNDLEGLNKIMDNCCLCEYQKRSSSSTLLRRLKQLKKSHVI